MILSLKPAFEHGRHCKSMSDEFEKLKIQPPTLNWKEADEILPEDLDAAADFFYNLTTKGKEDGTNFS